MPNLACEVGHHYCGLFSKKENLLEATINFIITGFEENDKVILIESDKERVANIIQGLGQRGYNVQALVDAGSLVLSTFGESYLLDGHFSLEKMIALLHNFYEDCISQGFSKLRVTAEPSWVYCVHNAAESFLEYERGVNEFFEATGSVALCSYSMDRWNHRYLLDILSAHPFAMIDG
jgi:hypothetical protein